MSNAFGIFSLNSPILISDSAFVPNFIESDDVLIIARGSLLQFYSVNQRANLQIELKFEYQTFGNISRIVPLKHPKDTQTNILLILNDLRFSILRYSSQDSAIKTMQTGNISSSQGTPISPPYRIALASNSLLLQINPQVLQFFQILPNSQLAPPINIPIPSKFIKDFDFLGSDDVSSKFAVLTEDFGQISKLQILEVDPLMQGIITKSGSHRDQTMVTVKNDSYAIKGLDSSSVLVFNTDTAFKYTINATTSPRLKSTTINTTSPLKKFTRMTPNLIIAADACGNLLSICLQENDAVPALRIGSINEPIALLKYDNRHLLSVSTSGESSLIELTGDISRMHSKATPIMTNSGSVKKIVEVNSNEFIGICGNGYSHIIRQSLILNEVAQIPLMAIESMWFYQDCLLLSVDTQTYLIRLTENEVEKIDNDSFVLNEPTLAFKQTSDNSFIQITPNKVNSNIDGSEINSNGNFHIITDASISNSYVAFIIIDESQYTIFILDYDLAEIRRIDAPVPVEIIAVSDTYMAAASWSENKVYVFSIETGELVRTIDKINCISLLFTQDFLILAETRDHVIYYPLAGFEDSENPANNPLSFYCNGMHYKLIPTDEPNDVIVAGECPVLIRDCVVNGIEYHGFKDGAVSGDKLCLIHDDYLSICHPSHFANTVHEEKSPDNIIDVVQIGNSQTKTSSNPYNFVVASRDKEGNFSLSVVEHPLSTLHPAWPKEEADVQMTVIVDEEPFVGMASIATDDPMKFLAIILNDHLLLFEVSDDMLLKRSDFIDLKNHAFQITSYGNRFIVRFMNEFRMYEPEIISHSDIQLKELTTMQTDGATSYISNDDEFVAVADELQSLVLYSYDAKPKKFNEQARNCTNFGLSMCRVAVDDYFVIDYNGNLFQMQIGNSNNTESRDLEIVSCVALGEKCSAMIVLSLPKKEKETTDVKPEDETNKDAQTKLLIATQSSQYIEVLSFDTTPEFEHIYRTIEREVQSLGRLTSVAYRTVLINNSRLLPCPTMYNLDLLKMFLDLDEESQMHIARSAEMDLQMIDEMCRHFLDFT